MLLVVLWLVCPVISDMSVHHTYVSRKSRSDSKPFETGYVYKQYNNQPGVMATYDVLTHQDLLNTPLKDTSIHNQPISVNTRPTVSLDYAKSESKFASKFLPSKIKTDLLYEKLKSAMHYKPTETDLKFGYENEYHIDDEDVRTISRGLQDSWPYYYHNPYEYEHMKIDAEVEKSKDKRYAVDAARVIPIHEDLSDDIPNSYEPVFTTAYYKETTTDNPMIGNDPFFSFTLNDYYNKKNDYEDELAFKGLDWDNFDRNTKFKNMPRINVRSNEVPNYNQNIGSISHKTQNQENAEKSVTHKGHDKQNEFDKQKKGKEEKSNEKQNYAQNEKGYVGFKDFVDSFTNKFGSEDHKKDSKYVLKTNQDKGENKKGFRRVYHKDEYQEDNEFYDNNNSSAKTEDKGSSNANIGGSEALLKSHATANLGEKTNAFDKFGEKEKNQYEHNIQGHSRDKGFDGHFQSYRDAAKQAAHSNIDDYFLDNDGRLI